MNCRKVNHLLSAYLDGELPGVEHRQIHLHLAQCGECRAEYEDLLRMKRLLAGLRVQTSRPELPPRIQARLASYEASRHWPSTRWSQFVHWIHGNLPSAPTLAIGASLAVVGIALTARGAVYAPDSHPADTIHVDDTTATVERVQAPSVTEFTTGLDPDALRRVSNQQAQFYAESGSNGFMAQATPVVPIVNASFDYPLRRQSFMIPSDWRPQH